jgi:hypothetical protein
MNNKKFVLAERVCLMRLRKAKYGIDKFDLIRR